MSIRREIPHIIKLAWPLLIAQVTQMLMGVSDTIMAGRVSATDMAAVAIASSIIFPILFFIQGVVLALPPIVSRLQGANDNQHIPDALFQTLWVAIALSIPLLCAQFALPWLNQTLEMEPSMKAIVIEYLSYMLYGAPSFALYQVFRSCAEGLSQTRPSMIITVFGLLLNIPANYVFIYGYGAIPAMGGAGCGIATTLVFTFMALASYLYTVKSATLSKYALYARWIWPNLAGMWEVIRLGVPIAMAMLFEVSLFAVVAILLSPFGADIVAAHQIALNFSALMFMIPLSIGMASTIRVGQLLGAKQKQEAIHAVQSAWLCGLTMALFTASMTFGLREFIASLYTTDIQVIQLAGNLMLLAAFFQFSDAMQVISGCALRGYKDAKAMFYITFLSYWGVGLSTGCILGLTDWITKPMAARGFWIGFITGLTAAAIMLTARLLIIQRRKELPIIEEVTA